jgi:hypothetical protein
VPAKAQLAGLASDSGVLVVVVIATRDARYGIPENVMVVLRGPRDTSVDLRLTDGRGAIRVPAPIGEGSVHVRTIGYQTVDANWQVRGGYEDSLITTLRLMPCRLYDLEGV